MKSTCWNNNQPTHSAAPAPVVEGLDNYTCRHFSRAYLRRLMMANETLGSTLLTLHKVHFYLDLMAQARAHIEAGDYGPWHRQWIERYDGGEAGEVTEMQDRQSREEGDS